MKRVLALVGAVLMVVVSLAIRARIDEETAGAGLTIACIPELEAYCRDLAGADFVVQEAAETVAALQRAEPEIDGWLTFEPWPEIAAIEARREPAAEPVRVAATPLVLAMAAERGAALAVHCGGDVGWRCLIDAAGGKWESFGGDARWGAVRVGLPARTSALGVVVTGAAVSGYFDSSDFATNDLDADDAFGAWFAKLRGAARTGDPFGEFVQRFPASYSAVAAPGVRADRGLGARADQIEVISPQPAVRLVAILAPVGGGGRRAGDVAALARSERLRERFTEAGWDEPPPPDAPSGLPDPGVLLALSRR